MQTTTNYGLKKPEGTDFYNVEDFNDSFDIIDTELKATSTRTDNAIAHLSDTSNPHGVTKEQVGLGNVPNVATNDQTPTYTVVSSNTALSSGEKLSAAMGKIAKAVSSLISHLSDTVGHITSAERTAWNGKLNATGGRITGQIVFAGGLSGSEGGEVIFVKPDSDNAFGSDISVDVQKNNFRVFATHNGSTKVFSVDYTTLKPETNIALHTGNSVPVVVTDTDPGEGANVSFLEGTIIFVKG
jgi:hypothetical protein